MKKFTVDVLWGLLVVVLMTACEFLVTLPFGVPPSEADMAAFMNKELLLTAVPVLLVTFFLAWIIRTDSKARALQRSIIWAAMVLIDFFVIGIGNDNLALIFCSQGIYALLLGTFAGPYINALIRKLP